MSRNPRICSHGTDQDDRSENSSGKVLHVGTFYSYAIAECVSKYCKRRKRDKIPRYFPSDANRVIRICQPKAYDSIQYFPMRKIRNCVKHKCKGYQIKK
jgi:hypothetical protein